MLIGNTKFFWTLRLDSSGKRVGWGGGKMVLSQMANAHRRGNSVSNLRVDYICLTKMHDIVLGFQVAFNVFI